MYVGCACAVWGGQGKRMRRRVVGVIAGQWCAKMEDEGTVFGKDGTKADTKKHEEDQG